MYVVYTYSSFIFNLFLPFFYFLCHLFVFIRFTLVLGHLCGRIEELYMSGITNVLDMLKSQMWRNSYFEESLLADLAHAVFIYAIFRFDANPKKPFLLGCYGISGKYCKKCQYFWVFLDIQIKDSWKSIISLLKYCTLRKAHFELQYWQPYFFHDFSYQGHDFFRFAGI